MLEEQDNFFDIPHSLPSSSHMAAVASRTPSGPVKVDSNQYMPDYGGIMEVPGTKTKQNGLRSGIPFYPNPYYVRVMSEEEEARNFLPRGPDCLIATSYLNLDGLNDSYRCDESFSTLRAIGKTLYIDLAKSIPCEPKTPDIHHFTTYGIVPYSQEISGLKYCNTFDNYVIVKFDSGIKLIKLNDCYRVPLNIDLGDSDGYDSDKTEVVEPEENSLPDRSPLERMESFRDYKPGVQVKDASLSKSQTWLYIADSDENEFHLKIYDLNRRQQCYNMITKIRDDDVKIRTELSQKQSVDRKKSLRSFVPSKPSLEELQQISCDPDHLMNSLMITSNRVSLIDPRENTVVMNYADKFKMSSASHTERFKRIEFSNFNSQQFYLMSDEKLRALDKRYPSKDLNIVDHTIDSTFYDVMTMKVAAAKGTEHETVCLSSLGNICILSFDQSRYTHSLVDSPGNLINPRSMHSSVHEPSPIQLSNNQQDELYGLAVCPEMIFEGEEVLFSTLQLSLEGDVCVRGFLKPRDDFLNFDDDLEKRKLSFKQSEVTHNSYSIENPGNPDLEGTTTNQPGAPTQDSSDQLNILDPNYVSDAEKSLSSKRANIKYDWMKKKLRSRLNGIDEKP